MSDLPEAAYHYQVIRRALDAIDAGPPGQSLDDLAARMGMSAAHFQRVFSAWVGVSPKRYQQYLTLGLARDLLARRTSLLDTAHELGLSGTGRLHDLFLRWEAMSPGDFARAGEGLTIAWGRFDTPFGPAIAMGTDRGICGLGFTSDMGDEGAFEDLRSRWPRASFVERPEALAGWMQAAFAPPGPRRGTVDLHLIGAPFQIKVWEALLRIPSGQVTTYSDIAQAIGHPRAMRAVGSAVGRNPVSFLIPCHRALRRDGGLGGYHWGLHAKRAILGWEAARADGTAAVAAS